MTSHQLRWELLHTIAGALFPLMMLCVVLGIFGLTITLKSGVELKVRVSWGYLLAVLEELLHFIANLALGNLRGAVAAGLLTMFWAFLYVKFREYEDEDNDDDDGSRRRASKVLGDKAKARLRQIVSRLKPSPAPRPLPVRN